MSVKRFDHDDAGYVTWRAEHLHDGYVANLDERNASGSRLHRANCSYLQAPVDAQMGLTDSFPKICSTTAEELLPYWKGGRRCSRCVP